MGIVPFSALQLLPAQKGNHKNQRKNANIGVFSKGNKEGYSELLYGIFFQKIEALRERSENSLYNTSTHINIG